MHLKINIKKQKLISKCKCQMLFILQHDPLSTNLSTADYFIL